VRGWWRYHQLFADLLRARLERDQPNRALTLHRAAAAWCEDHGLVDEAVRHTLAAGEATWSTRLIERHFDTIFRRAEDATLAQWLTALPAELVRARPRLCLVQAFWALVDGRLEAAEQLLDDAEYALAATADEPYEPSVGSPASLVANVPAAIALLRARLAHLRGDAEQTSAFARRAMAELGEDEAILGSLTRWYLAVADWLRGRLAEAEPALVSSTAEWRGAGPRILAVWGYHYLGQLQRAQGRLGAALRTYQQALEVAKEPGGATLELTGIASVGVAEVLYERGELDSAARHALKGVALCRQFPYAPPLATGLAILAWIQQAQGDQAGALNAMREAERVKPSPAVVALLNPVPTVRARLALARGEVAEAARWIQVSGLAAEDEPSYPREREYLVLARVLLAEHDPNTALGLLGRLLALAVAQKRIGSIIELRALQALAHAACGNEPAALDALIEGLRLGEPEGYLRVFVDEGPVMAALFRTLLATRRHTQAASGAAEQEYLSRLVEAFEQAGLPIRPPARRGAVVVAGLIEPLSARELEVLALLAAGRRNRDIAEELVVTLETVKKHLTHIFDKLGTTNRTQAVARARELGLLP
jgi:LuxR family transcriptional regulator, maltose regulon positive regulatory protein